MRRRRRPSNIMHFKREIVATVSVPLAGLVDNLQFALSDVSNSGEFSALFRLYRLNKIVVRYEPNVNMNPATVTSLTVPHVMDFVTPDPITGTITNITALENSTVRHHRPFQTFTRKFTPAIESVVSTSAAGTSFVGSQSRYKQWLQTSALGIPHFGYCAMFQPSSIASTYTRFVKYYFSCKFVQ